MSRSSSQAVIDVGGRSVVLAYSSMEAEYGALRRRAVVVQRGHCAWMRFSGPKAADVLTGLVTNDVGALAAGQGQYAAALTAKGKVVADLRILRMEDSFLTEPSPRARDGWFGLVRKYVNPRLATYSDESLESSSLGVYGVQARYVVEQMTGLGHSALAMLPPYAHVTLELLGSQVSVMRSPDLELEGYDFFMPAALADPLWRLAVDARATPAGLAAWEVARIEAGRPEWGVDMDDATIPQEANLDALNAISYTKGCYTGQEVVARVHFRGHVNRMLRGLRASGTASPPARASLFDDSGKSVGDVRSSVVSPRLGGIALGMVRREVEPGTRLIARWSAAPAGDAAPGEMPLDMVPLPFPLE